MASNPLSELRDLHMPPMDLSATVAEALAALSLGLLAAWALASVIRAVTSRTVSAEVIALRRLDALGAGEGDDAVAARAAILQEYADTVEGGADWLSRLDERFGGLFTSGAGKDLRAALYQPHAAFDLPQFDAALRAALAQAKR